MITSKANWFAVLNVCGDMVIALLSLKSVNPVSQTAMIEKIVCRLGCPKVSHIKTMRAARYCLYCVVTAQCERLLPTSGPRNLLRKMSLLKRDTKSFGVSEE